MMTYSLVQGKQSERKVLKINGQSVDHSSSISYKYTVVVVSIHKEIAKGVVLCCEVFFCLQMMGVLLSVASKY
jgi:hypothetical protein